MRYNQYHTERQTYRNSQCAPTSSTLVVNDNDACQNNEEETRDDPVPNDGENAHTVHIDHEKGLLYCGGSEDFLKEIISMYVADDKRTDMQNAYDSGDWNNYRILVHTVKSTSRTIGAMELGDKAQTLENAVKELDEDRIRELHKDVMESYSAVLGWCRKAYI